MVTKETIILFFHYLRNIILKFPLIRNTYLLIESKVYPTLRNRNNREFIKNNIDYNQNLFQRIISRIKEFNKNYTLKGKTILEIGPGNTILLAIIFILNGAKKVYLVDRFKLIYT